MELCTLDVMYCETSVMYRSVLSKLLSYEIPILSNWLQLYRENMFEEMLQEKEEIAAKRKRCKEILRVLQQAAWVPPSLLLMYTVTFLSLPILV